MFFTVKKHKILFLLVILLLPFFLLFITQQLKENQFTQQSNRQKSPADLVRIDHDLYCSSISAEDKENRVYIGDEDEYKKMLRLERHQQIPRQKYVCDFSTTDSLEAMFLHNSNEPSKIYKKSYFQELAISHWNVSHIKNMSGFFNSNPVSIDLSAWDTSQVEDMSFMFAGSLFNHDISKWDVSQVRTMQNMFYVGSFNRPIGDWNVGRVENMFDMFGGSVFNQNINSWDVSNVKTMSSMFASSRFNQPLDRWDVSNVQDMSAMFSGAQYFNQDLSQWCVAHIKTKPINFDDQAHAWENKNKPVWGTCPRGENQRKRKPFMTEKE